MPDNPQTTQTGSSELKNYYDPNDSIYEAIRRRRKKKMQQFVDLPDDTSIDQVPNPDL
jgi:hypothetical protein